MILGTSGFSFSFRSSRAFHCSLKFLITVFQAMFDGVSVAGTRYQEVQKFVEVKIRGNNLVHQWGVDWSANPR